ncbi:MAG: hypothetical protein K8T25_13090 [Planctomycetia bacterium]|nr:hypothetical protein [Planctomycetia bacterium]
MPRSTANLWSRAIAVGIVLVACHGCKAPHAAVSYKSPQEVFDAANSSVEKKDYQGFCQCLTADTQDQMAGFLVLGPLSLEKMMMALPPQPSAIEAISRIDKVFQQHGVDTGKIDLEALGKFPQKTPAEKSEEVKRLAAGIKDKPAFISDMILAMESNAKSQGNFIQSRLPFGNSRLEDLKIEGDSATGTAVDKTNGQKTPVTFSKVNEGWLISRQLDHF